ncbi:histidine kinase [Mucilaginibacter hurinus]|uniref:histidine kinase n=1 Tax=Mucilaginibacter hurinus TaxID=2201324 RepID=A0A367GQW2_9SPHI|nr:histidine kinase dimerization/phospho-acceptor domain-containing protein [Mucilaginibacter hurinus]RCH55465.1 histidine kinase [Mucilaginibacter hurinus]
MLHVDLTNCDNEPIRIPGRVQSHGFLIAVDQDLKICFCSENTDTFLGEAPGALLGKPVDVLNSIGDQEEDMAGIIRRAAQLRKRDNTIPTGAHRVMIKGQALNLVINPAEDYLLAEFEPEDSSLDADLQQMVGRSLSEILADKQLDKLLTNTAEQVRRITRYDRVMVYKFHTDGHGEVVAEAKNDTLESWLGLHYPASDIPRQARDLYKHNLVRLIADVNTEPAAIVTNLNGQTGASLDLTSSMLRAVSPIHIQYLKNMEVASSFSVSIRDQGELWGLIACHSYSPRFINFNQRESAKLVGQVLSSAISFRQQEEDQQKATRSRTVVEQLTRNLLRNTPVEEALIKYDVTFADAIESTGAALLFENQLYTIGKTPENDFIERLITWLEDKMESSIYATSNLSADFPDAAEHKGMASGLLACRLSRELDEYMLWFRPEVITHVTWAGNPEKNIEVDSRGMQIISPRNSFEAWSQDVKYTSAPWSKHDTDTALLLKDEINYSISRKATELRILNEKLREAYAELDSFSYTISHDLKNPLTAIKSYSQLIVRRFELPEQVKTMVERIEGNVVKMQDMIDEVLNYSKIGQAKLRVKAINMQKLLDELRRDMIIASDNPNLRLEIKETPEVHGDETMVLQVFSNLVGNAVKYSGKSDIP